jgi:hypothetical protein
VSCRVTPFSRQGRAAADSGQQLQASGRNEGVAAERQLPRPVSAWNQASGGARALKIRRGESGARNESSVRNRSVLTIGGRNAEGAADGRALPAKLMIAQSAQDSTAGDAGFAGFTTRAVTRSAAPNATTEPVIDPGPNRWKWLGNTTN